MRTGTEKYNPYNGNTHKPLSEMATAEALLGADEFSYNRRGILSISFPKWDDAPPERTAKLHALAASIAGLSDIDPRNIQPIDRENTLRITNPGPGLRLAVQSIVTDEKKVGLHLDKSTGSPSHNAKSLVEAIETARASKPALEQGVGRF